MPATRKRAATKTRTRTGTSSGGRVDADVAKIPALRRARMRDGGRESS